MKTAGEYVSRVLNSGGQLNKTRKGFYISVLCCHLAARLGYLLASTDSGWRELSMMVAQTIATLVHGAAVLRCRSRLINNVTLTVIPKANLQLLCALPCIMPTQESGIGRMSIYLSAQLASIEASVGLSCLMELGVRFRLLGK